MLNEGYLESNYQFIFKKSAEKNSSKSQLIDYTGLLSMCIGSIWVELSFC